MRKTGCFLLMLSVLSGSPALAATKSIAKDKVNLRTGPGFEHSVLLQAPLGYPVQIEGEDGKWLNMVDWDGNRAWVYSPLVCDVRTAVVLVEDANIRNAPGTKNKVVKKARRGEIYTILEERSEWVKIGYYYDRAPVGWIRNDLVFGE
jgi:SH3-like domain-containing protein